MANNNKIKQYINKFYKIEVLMNINHIKKTFELNTKLIEILQQIFIEQIIFIIYQNSIT